MELTPYLSLVIPVFNEEENLVILTEELIPVLESVEKQWEILFINDGSTDRSLEILRDLTEKNPGVKLVSFDRNYGQTAAFAAGFQTARGEVIITLDADLQNDPRDIPKLLEKIGEYDIVCGWRRNRRDSFIRKVSSRIANAVRNRLSGETIKDTGCSLKAVKNEYAKKIKLYNGMHRFFPTLVKMEGGIAAEVAVNHRPRKYGEAKYNIRNRLARSFLDLLAVCWMKNRNLEYKIKEIRS